MRESSRKEKHVGADVVRKSDILHLLYQLLEMKIMKLESLQQSATSQQGSDVGKVDVILKKKKQQQVKFVKSGSLITQTNL